MQACMSVYVGLGSSAAVQIKLELVGGGLENLGLSIDIQEVAIMSIATSVRDSEGDFGATVNVMQKFSVFKVFNDEQKAA